MTIVRRLFAAPPAHNRLDVILWWELRRVPYNLVLGFIGCIDIIAMAFANMLGPLVAVGSILFAVAANVCYTAGWITELAWIGPDLGAERDFAPRAFRAGLAFSCLLTSLPVWIALFVTVVRRFTEIFPR